jgi:hypothetical protein
MNTSTIQGSTAALLLGGEEHPKYRQMETALKEREAQVERLQGYSIDLEGKLQKLLGDFT